MGETLAGVLLEIFDDSWGAVNSPARSLTETQLQEWWVTLVAVPQITLFDARKTNLSKIGTDAQMLSGDHATSRKWALALARHPQKINGIYYPSRHDSSHCNLAIFKQGFVASEILDPALRGPAITHAGRTISRAGPMAMAYGPPVLLAAHPELRLSLLELEVAILP